MSLSHERVATSALTESSKASNAGGVWILNEGVFITLLLLLLQLCSAFLRRWTRFIPEERGLWRNSKKGLLLYSCVAKVGQWNGQHFDRGGGGVVGRRGQQCSTKLNNSLDIVKYTWAWASVIKTSVNVCNINFTVHFMCAQWLWR